MMRETTKNSKHIVHVALFRMNFEQPHIVVTVADALLHIDCVRLLFTVIYLERVFLLIRLLNR